MRPMHTLVHTCPSYILPRKTHAFDNNSLDTILLRHSFLHILGRFNAVEVVDGNVAAFFGEGVAEDFAEAAGLRDWLVGSGWGSISKWIGYINCIHSTNTTFLDG